jgi:uncharacterized protein YcgL (UPF0745 family)
MDKRKKKIKEDVSFVRFAMRSTNFKLQLPKQ